jgi:cyclophilin family peptidyl-prolyl cis-trans isomerase
LLIGLNLSFISVNARNTKQSTTKLNDEIFYVGGDGPGNYSTIQEALDISDDGDTIFVYSKNTPYYENIIIENTVLLLGEDKETTIIDGELIGSVIKNLADSVLISGFTIQNSAMNRSEYSGIESHGSNNYYVGNILLNNKVGVHILNGDSNTVAYNFISGSQTESICIHTSYNVAHRNNIEGNAHGIWLQKDATVNEIKQNNFKDNEVYNAAVNKARKNLWDENYWDDWIGLKISFLNFLPKGIKGFFGFFRWFNLDWNPALETYEITNHPLAIMDTTMGEMVLELYTDKMPITSENFIKLSKIGFFTELVFHRVIDDFVIQGGGYYANGTNKKSPYDPIVLEIHPEVMHVDGAISMARTNDPNSATSQFFICDGPQHRLDGNYSAFGKVINGLDVLRNIASVETKTRYFMKNWPVDDIIINSVTILEV